MAIKQRIALLKSIYHIYDQAVASVDPACGPRCAACCTCNVTCTTLEGWLVFNHLLHRAGRRQIEAMLAAASPARYRPTVTLNHMAQLCLQGQSLPPEVNDPAAGDCPCLQLDLCSLYDARPFGCRAMLSTLDCRQTGEAQMPPFVLSLNNVIMQYLEAIDRPGGWGNLIDVLGFLADDTQREAYENRVSQCLTSPLLANRPFPVLMIPPEHRQAMGPIIRDIKTVMGQTDSTRQTD